MITSDEQEKERIRKIHEDRKLRRIEDWPKMEKEIIESLPPLFQLNLSKLEEKDVIKEYTLTEKGVYISGNVGTGKTMFILFLVINYLKNKWCEEIKRPSFIFTTTVSLLSQFKRCISNTSEVNESDLFTKYSEVDILILDDFGGERITEWSYGIFYEIIDFRYSHMKKTLFTSNFNLPKLAERLGDDRIPSRIQEMCEIFEKEGIDFRSKL
jgi:DNA replication protein DnaC